MSTSPPRNSKSASGGRSPAASRARSLAWRWALALVLLIGLGVLAIGPTNLAAAMQKLLGYIPGIGLVDNASGLRVLEAPVSLEREGITVTVEQAVADGQRTVVLMRVDGIPPEARPRSEDSPSCGENPHLVLDDETGSGLLGGRIGDAWGTEGMARGDVVSGGGRGWGSGYASRLVYPGIPTEVDEVIFFVPCLFDTAPGQAPGRWSLPLRFVPAPPETTVFPVFDVTPSPEASQPTGEPEGAGLVLERVIELEDRYILIGTFRQGQGMPGGTALALPVQVEIAVADGQPWVWDYPSDVDLGSYEPGVIPWAYAVLKGFTTPITLSFASVDVEYPADVMVQLNVGANPAVGQEWALEQVLQVAGREVRLVSAARVESGYELRFASQPSIFGVSIVDVDHAPVGGWGGGSQGEVSAGFEYAAPAPTGTLRFRITGVLVSVPGPWTLTWSPPPGAAQVTPLALPTPCLTLDRWQEILAERPALPPGLSGRLISEWHNTVTVLDLATGQQQVVGTGNWPDLSADGRLAAYSGTDSGLHVVDLATGEDRTVPGTTINDYNPRWSPDGAWLAFRRIDDLNLYRVHPDGSGLERVTQGPEYELLVDWTSDGSGHYFGVPGAEGLTLRLLDLATGTARDLFTIDAKEAFAAISPDEGQIAYVARVPGSMGYALYLSPLDGAAPRLLVQADPWSVTLPLWSPDGKWLLVTLASSSSAQAEMMPALLAPETCQAVPVGGITGYVWDWAP